MMYDEIIKCKGDNTFKLPHMSKQKLRLEGRLPSNVAVSEAAGEVLWREGEADAEDNNNNNINNNNINNNNL